MVLEIICYQSSIIHMCRTTPKEINIGGKAIAKGDRVVMWHVSGNWDEEAIDAPDQFNIQRTKPQRYLAFGAGIHRCVGDRLAEQQLQILWKEILKRNLQF